MTVELFVPDVEAGVRFYTDDLGVELLRMERGTLEGKGQATFAVVKLGAAALLIAHESLEGSLAMPPGGGIHIRIVVDDVDAMYARARERRVPIVSEIGDREYGLRDFILRDPHGFHLRFASPLRQR
jgi:catechol 2,3-dioxygenase-like lactoylglutathione lyase family enzyme